MQIITWNDPLMTLTAKVDAVMNPADYLEWERSFTPALIPDDFPGENPLPFDGVNANNLYGDQQLGAGVWSFAATTGACDAAHPISIIIHPDQPEEFLFATLTALNAPAEFTIPPNTSQSIRIIQSGALATANVMMIKTADFDTDGEPPSITTHGDTLTALWNDTPRTGVLTAMAKVYAGNGALITSSNEILLTITGSSEPAG